MSSVFTKQLSTITGQPKHYPVHHFLANILGGINFKTLYGIYMFVTQQTTHLLGPQIMIP